MLLLSINVFLSVGVLGRAAKSGWTAKLFLLALVWPPPPPEVRITPHRVTRMAFGVWLIQFCIRIFLNAIFVFPRAFAGGLLFYGCAAWFGFFWEVIAVTNFWCFFLRIESLQRTRDLKTKLLFLLYRDNEICKCGWWKNMEWASNTVYNVN